MNELWSSPDGLPATELRDRLADRDLALTTVHTVLSRLERKGFVARRREERPHRYQTVSTREEYVAEIMSDALGQAPDREAVLARFLGSVTKDETALLRRLLGRSTS